MSQKHKTRRSASPAVKSAAAGNGELAAIRPGPSARSEREQRTWLEAWAVSISRWLGSLQIAVVLLVFFAAALMAGVVVETWFNAKTAGELVYRSWWFALLLLLLGVNIFFAAAKKWPWKKHQTGFLITHLGLLTMLAGGILNALGGTDAQMQLIDTDDPDLLSRTSFPQESNRILFSDVSTIRVRRIAAGRDHKEGWKTVGEEDFVGGPLPWKSDAGPSGYREWTLAVLDFLRNPLPRSWSLKLSDGARLDVVNFYPQSKHDLFSVAKPGQEGAPAFKLELQSPRFGTMDEWLAADRKREFSRLRGMPGYVEFMGKCPDVLLKEFLEPPATSELGNFGVLVLFVDGSPYRFPVDKNLQQSVAVGDSGYRIRMTGYHPVFRDPNDNQPPDDPVVEFELTGKNGVSGDYLALARRFLGNLIPQHFFNREKRKPTHEELAGLKVWYHPPDYRYGREGIRGVLQFVHGTGDRLYYRSFNSKVGGFNFESSGEVTKGADDGHAIWSGMNGKFRVLEHLPEAVPEDRYTYRKLKENEKPGEDGTAVLRCRIVAGGKAGSEFWVAQHEPKTITVDGEHYRIDYDMKSKTLPFSIKLERAESTVDPGTQQAATYTSYVQLTDKEKGIEGERRIITMNEPLEHRWYSFYQSDFTPLGVMSAGKPVSRSGLTVAFDPGLLLKYAGTCLLPLGVAIMFYMKAYFFKPRGRREPTLEPGTT